MTTVHEGGCLCGAVRYRTLAAPLRVTICHCTFCQKLTGSAFLVEPIFSRDAFVLSGGAPRRYDHRSDTSGKRVTLNFCDQCGTPLYLDLERFPDVVGVCGGTFDDPNWFERTAQSCRHIYTRSAQDCVVLPAGLKTYSAHALGLDGMANEPVVHMHAFLVSRRT